MKTSKPNIIEMEAKELCKTYGGTERSGGCISDPFKIKTVYDPVPSPDILI